MKRTAQDFADEATRHDPYEIELEGGKTIRPKAASHFTYEEGVGQQRVAVAWAKWFQDNPYDEPPTDPTDPQYVQRPFDYDMDVRFGKDREKFWAEWSKYPVANLRRMLEELDRHYDPTPASTAEVVEAEADPAGDTAGKSPSGGES